MSRRRLRVLAAIGGVWALVAGAAWAADTTASQIPSTGDKPAGAPGEVKMPWGTFKLAPRIAEKIAKHEKINYVFSYQGSGIPLFSPQFAAGFKHGCEAGNAIYPLECSRIAPVQTNPTEQVAQIDAKLAAGEIDCISIEPTTSDATTAIVNRLMAQGIPAFTVGVTSRGHEFTNFTQIPIKEGNTAADAVLAWMKESGHTLKVYAVSGGDPAEFWAKGRMKGFREGILKAIPDAKFLNTEANGLNTSYEPGRTFDTYKAFFSAHPDLELMENVDIGAEHGDRAVRELNRIGKTFMIGWNVSKGQLDAIDAGIQIALFDQRWPDQAAFGGPACAQFLGNGVVLPNTQTLKVVTKADTATARAQLSSIMSSGN